MRDAFGGTFLMYMIIIFITIFITFMSETLKYVQAYRAKNAIINYIEEYEGFNQEALTKIEDETIGYMNKSGYHADKVCNGGANIPKKANEYYCSNEYGYKVEMKYNDGKQAYYKVTTYITLDFTKILFMEDPLSINITGETRFVTLDGTY